MAATEDNLTMFFEYFPDVEEANEMLTQILITAIDNEIVEEWDHRVIANMIHSYCIFQKMLFSLYKHKEQILHSIKSNNS